MLGCCDPIEVGCNRQWGRVRLGCVHEDRARNTETVAAEEEPLDSGCVVEEGATSSCATGRESVAAAFGRSHHYMYPNAVALPLDLDPPSRRFSVVTRSICSASGHMTCASFKNCSSAIAATRWKFASTSAWGHYPDAAVGTARSEVIHGAASRRLVFADECSWANGQQPGAIQVLDRQSIWCRSIEPKATTKAGDLKCAPTATIGGWKSGEGSRRSKSGKVDMRKW